MSTLREAAKALVESEQSYGRQCGEARCIWCDANPADEAHGDGCEFGALVRALESETREADPCDYAPGETVMNLYDKAREEGRREGIEEAARWCDTAADIEDPAYRSAYECAARHIRSLSTPPPANTENDR